MSDNKVDGVKKLTKEELERNRQLVLESIGEARKDEPALSALSGPAVKKLDGLQPMISVKKQVPPPAPAAAKPKAVPVPDLLSAAKNEDPEIGKELSEEKRRRWQAEIGQIFAPKEKPLPSRPVTVDAVPAKKEPEKPKPPLPKDPVPAVSRVNPFQNKIVEQRIEERKRLADEAKRQAESERKREAEERQREAELKRREKEIEEKDRLRRIEQEKLAKEEKRQKKQEAAKARRERYLKRWDDIGRTFKNIPAHLAAALKKVILVFAFGLVLTVFIYALVAVAVVKLNVDNPYIRSFSRYLPVPAYIGKDGVIDFYRYKDIRGELSLQGLSGEVLEQTTKTTIVEQAIIDKLAIRYGLVSQPMTESTLKSQMAGYVIGDDEINQVGIARIAKINEMILQSGDFVKISNKYGDSQGQMTITAANRDQYPYYYELRNLAVNQNSGIVYADQGYYIFRCFDRKGEDLYLSFVFVRGLGLNDYLAQETKNYWLWSLVD